MRARSTSFSALPSKNKSLKKADAVDRSAIRSAGVASSHDRITRRLTKRMKQQELLSYLSQLALANVELELFMNEVAYQVARVLNTDFSKILELLPGKKRMLLLAGYGWNKAVKPGRTWEAAGRGSQAGYTIQVRRPVIVSDMRSEKRFNPSGLFSRHGVRCGASVVIYGEEWKPYGVLGVYSRSQHAFSQDDMNFLQSIANLLALTLQRKSAERELRRFQYMADNANIGISLIDGAGRIRYANRKTYERLGLTRDEYMQRRIIHNSGSGTRSKFKDTFDLIQKTSIPPIETYEVARDEEKRVPLEINVTGVKFEGEPYMFAVSQDISERIRSRNNLQFLAESSLMLGQSLDYRDTLDAVARAAVSHVADWCSVDLVDAQEGVAQVAVAHNDPKKVKWAKALRKRMPVDMSAPRGLPNVLRTGKPELYSDITDELLRASAKSDTEYRIMRKVGFRSAMIVPLKSGKRVVGGITFVTTGAGRNYDKDDLAIAVELANRASLAIENSRLYSEIENQRERLDKIVANVPGVVWEMWLDQRPEEGRTNFVSEFIQEMCGYSAEEWLRPRFWLSVVHPDDRERAEMEQAKMIRERRGMVQRHRWMHKNGRTLWVESHVSIIMDEKGRVQGMRGVSMDITERMELEKRKDEFISMASHELKTPVTTLKVFTQILLKNAERMPGDNAATYLSKMDGQISRLTDLINDLLDLSKIQTGKLSFTPSVFSMDDLVDEIVEQIQPTTDEHRIVVRGSTRSMVQGDRDRLGQVLINLITNAIKYSPGSGAITVRLSERQGSVFVEVEDQGIGISSDQQKKIFTRFYQVEDGTQKTYPGLGIGLYISDQIVRRHGGSIAVRSEKGKGSCFTVRLPLEREPEAAFDNANAS